MRFVDVLVRQAHPGPGAPAYHDLATKLADARRYVDGERIPWPVLVDDLEGTVHRAYGGLADPTYLLDVDGRIAFAQMWTHVPTLHRALETLSGQRWTGVAAGGVDRKPHVLAAMTDGWRGLERGLPQRAADMRRAAPGMAEMARLGYRMRRVFGPVTLRPRPLPAAVRYGAMAGAAFLVLRMLAGGRGKEEVERERRRRQDEIRALRRRLDEEERALRRRRSA